MDYHHGYLLVGNVEKARSHAFESATKILETKIDTLEMHPDFAVFEKPQLTITDARDIRDKSSKKSFLGKGRVFVIQANFFTKEATNALLKTFEEPAGSSHFFLITSSLGNVLETLRSRMAVLNFEIDRSLSKEKEKFVLKFLKSSISKRMEMTGSFEDDKEKILNFLGGLEIIFRESLVSGFSEEDVLVLDKLNEQRKFIYTRGLKPKLVTDFLALTLPRK